MIGGGPGVDGFRGFLGENVIITRHAGKVVRRRDLEGRLGARVPAVLVRMGGRGQKGLERPQVSTLQGIMDRLPINVAGLVLGGDMEIPKPVVGELEGNGPVRLVKSEFLSLGIVSDLRSML